MTSFLYPRTIRISRQNTPSAVGAVGYSGDDPANETTILSGIAAGVQSDRLGNATPSDLPSASKLSYYKILIPSSGAALGTINKNDIVTDDVGQRYQVVDNYHTTFGYQMRVMVLSS